MGRHACAKLPGIASCAAILICLAASARAGEASYCVTCTGPDQTYRCRVTGEGSKPSDALKLYCVIRTAKEGHHASCSAENATPACAGVEKVYSYDGPAIPDDLAQDPRVKSLMNRINHDNEAFAKPKGQGPQTMVELTARALSASRQGLRNARSALGGSSEQTTSPCPPHRRLGATLGLRRPPRRTHPRRVDFSAQAPPWRAPRARAIAAFARCSAIAAEKRRQCNRLSGEPLPAATSLNRLC